MVVRLGPFCLDAAPVARDGTVNLRHSSWMPDDVVRYPRYRFPPAIISHAVWLYYRAAKRLSPPCCFTL
jgi:hypothetical protein